MAAGQSAEEEAFAEELHRLRGELGVTQQEAADIVRVSATTWQNWETALFLPTERALHALLRHHPDTTLEQLWRSADLQRRRRLQSASGLREAYAALSTGTSQERGAALEQFVQQLVDVTPGLEVIRRNARLAAEEIDLLVDNQLDHGFWRTAGSPIVVECKNRVTKVSASEVTVLAATLRSIGPSAGVGILVTRAGVTGRMGRDATQTIREARQRGQFILVLADVDLQELASGGSLLAVLDRRRRDVLLL